MPLLGWPLEALLAMLLVAVVVLMLVLWPRVRGGRVLRTVQRLGLVFVSQPARHARIEEPAGTPTLCVSDFQPTSMSRF